MEASKVRAAKWLQDIHEMNRLLTELKEAEDRLRLAQEAFSRIRAGEAATS